MQVRNLLGLMLIAATSFVGAAKADVVQTTVGIQQNTQSQYLEGRGFQTGVSVQNLGQSQMARPSFRGENIQQTTAGVQTSEHAQVGYGRVNQALTDVRNLQQRQLSNGYNPYNPYNP
jgi:hypothetical protein